MGCDWDRSAAKPTRLASGMHPMALIIVLCASSMLGRALLAAMTGLVYWRVRLVQMEVMEPRSRGRPWCVVAEGEAMDGGGEGGELNRGEGNAIYRGARSHVEVPAAWVCGLHVCARVHGCWLLHLESRRCSHQHGWWIPSECQDTLPHNQGHRCEVL
ncbi:hypothetical protein Vretimale_19378 [Volvox reticuliferus]|uniref:Uncharacterized protein n=1 Tax=Volvox reticuliferus TaxID=1737510 RepID=A0A8J4D6T6_9CHLO|nr:hypothetical protein Vretifemale_20629 [Volvox reticuliferus]GIM16802.1 hypothetical protein Vretimale_19378 [Volvox reticuliferus]